MEAALAKGTIPITIGGDHSLAIGSIAGVSNHYHRLNQNFGLVWFDAHGDINTPDTMAVATFTACPLPYHWGRAILV